MTMTPQNNYELKTGPVDTRACQLQLAMYETMLHNNIDKDVLPMIDTKSVNIEEAHSELRHLHMQLIEAAESNDTNAKRRANIDADRYLMANKEFLLPILIDALAQQIRGIRSAEAPVEFHLDDSVIKSQLIALEDFLLNPATWPPPPEMYKKPSLLSRLFKRKDDSNVKHSLGGVKITADIKYSVKLKDGRYGVVQVRHDNGLMEVKGPQGLFTATDDELLVAIAPPKRKHK